MTLPVEDPPSIGQICYEAFAASVSWKFRGAQLPPWARLEQFEREAFTAGAQQAMQKGWIQSRPTVTRAHHRDR